ncbi:restriction endonuclease subunit S [Acinetobacter junii]|uniref:restriction endonuclease subunit S n=1 Tax=Acinetobacter junii TaxID=40215 RepID=UPI000C1B1FA1|nr:restriction endonuclease subunit S [Acinetobacter junii]ATU44959.1 restriction endonuclease subunit S [Acinetobacter junii]
MSKYQKYAEYKYSGVEWLEKIPNHWEATQVKYGYVVTLGKMLQSTPKSSLDELKPYLKAQNVQPNGISINQVELMWFSPEDRKKLLLEKGDVLVSEGGDVGRSAIWNAELEECYIQNAINRVRPKYMNDSKYFLYWMEFLKSTDFINIICNKATIAHYTAEKLESSPIFLPPSSEQNKIANFLDHETAKIDTLIAKQEKLIELLKEKRQAVISHAVTKGLNPNVAMKDSGVEWLGQVPEHWVVKSYRHASRIYRGKFGHRPRNDPAFYDGDYPFIQTGDVARAGKYITSYSQTLNEKGKDVSQLFPKGTLMMAIAANIGDLAILGFEAYAPDSVVGFKPNQQIDLEFLRYSFMAALPALEQTSTQSTQANLNVERIGAVHGVFPSFEEQREIVNHLDELLDKYNIIEKEMNKAINLLQERRTALISAAVTGKIDVRNWQNPDKKNEANMELSA